MLAIFITIGACVAFFVAAKKRAQSPFKWAALAFVAFYLPAFAVGFILAATGIPADENHNLQTVLSILAFVIGFYLLVLMRKQLYRFPLSEEYRDQNVSERDLEIKENEGGTFSIDGRTFNSRQDAEDYRSLVTG